jgi:hypothetical protein
MMRALVTLLAAAALLPVFWSLVFVSLARAHQTISGVNYPTLCCSNRDCRPAPAGSVREMSDGYHIVSTGEVVPYSDKRIKQALDTDLHLCQQAGNFDKGRVLCLFPPLQGF